MEFSLLGPLVVVDGEREVSIPPGQRRAVLIDLLLHANAVVSVERLIDDVWEGSPPPTATKILQLHISNLRRDLGRDRVEHVHPGYLLHVAEGEVDVARAEGLARDAAESPPERALVLLEEALSLWRGEPLADVDYASFARGEVERLEELRLTLVERRMDALLGLGREDEVVHELEALAARHPTRERLRAQLMLALYRTNRQADALASYRVARAALREELGLEPGPELQRLERQILEQDPALERAARPGASRPETKTHRRRLVALGALAACGVVAAAVAALLLSGRSAAEPLRQDSVVELRGSAMQRGDAFRVGRSPRAVATDSAGRLWVANFADETVVRIDPRSGQATSFGVGEAPTALAVGDGGVWVGSSFGRALVRLGATKAASALPFPADGLAFGRGSVWSVNQRAGTLVATDPDSLASRVVLRGLKGPSAVAFADGVLWIPESFARRLLRVDPETGRVKRFRLPLAPESVAVGCGAVWLTNPAADEVTEWRLRDHFPRLIAVGFSPTSVAVGSKTAWVVNDIAHSVEAIDCTTATPVRTLTLGRNGVAGPKLTPGGVGASGDTAWVAIDGF